jgi:hypothetical protein
MQFQIIMHLKHCANFITSVVTQVFNYILCSGVSPNSWKKALITPVAKVSKPESYADLRPISLFYLFCREFFRELLCANLLYLECLWTCIWTSLLIGLLAQLRLL